MSVFDKAKAKATARQATACAAAGQSGGVKSGVKMRLWRVATFRRALHEFVPLDLSYSREKRRS